MTEIDALKYELEENRKSFDTLHKKYVELLKQQGRLEKENEQLKFKKDRYKRLSEIRQESINNRILTIKDFIDNCSDKEVKKTLEQLFHSEVKEYDLSKKIRKLEKENEQLKQELFESEKECLMIDYRDNPIRRNDKIIDLKEEYKERFGRDFE